MYSQFYLHGAQDIQYIVYETLVFFRTKHWSYFTGDEARSKKKTDFCSSWTSNKPPGLVTIKIKPGLGYFYQTWER
jgi:hypothetical protein